MNEEALVALVRGYHRRWILTVRAGSFHATHRQAWPPVTFEDETPEGLAGQLREWEKQRDRPEGSEPAPGAPSQDLLQAVDDETSRLWDAPGA
jgi:hypothetical protein